jgi:hypothetical protein
VHSKNKPKPTRQEAEHIEAVKLLSCVICDAPPPCDAHEPVQGLWFCSIALCRDCHMGSENGIHGRKTMWRIRKMDEWDAVNETLRRLLA